MKIRPREQLCTKASLELDVFIDDVIKKYGLTTGESLRVVVHSLSRWIGSLAKYTIRAERHPDDPDKPGGMA